VAGKPFCIRFSQEGCFRCCRSDVAGGLVSLLRGQDANWDLRNYHLYNGYAWLHDRLALDLAPAQMQSYFSPLLDVLHAGLMLGLPAPVGGFVLGVLHGAVFVPLSWVIWQVLGERPDRARLAPLLAFAGLCTAAFLSEFGNTMGDNLSAGFVIAALALAMQARRFDLVDRAAATVWCLAGAALGMAVAFKLTNALYAVALGVAVLLCGGRWRTRIVGGALLTMSACTVFVLLAGHWYFRFGKLSAIRFSRSSMRYSTGRWRSQWRLPTRGGCREHGASN
jgi:hypothetical protein